MAQNTHTFRVFVSPTFSDLKAERNALQARVFPRLRELAQQDGPGDCHLALSQDPTGRTRPTVPSSRIRRFPGTAR